MAILGSTYLVLSGVEQPALDLSGDGASRFDAALGLAPPLETAAGPVIDDRGANDWGSNDGGSNDRGRNDRGPNDQGVQLPPAASDTRIFPFDAQAASGRGKARIGESLAALPIDMPATASTAALRAPYYVQFHSLESWAAAQKAWIELLADNVGLLAHLEPRVEKITLEDSQRTHYRLQAGIVETRAEAQLLCQRLRGRNIECLVVAPSTATGRQ